MGPQQTIAHYRITAKLGEGGMGEVWRATDTKLGREVAIKVLPGSLAADPDRMARFQREALVLASLNHPNIAAIYGVEDRALVMEFVEGPTLAERIAQGPLPLDDALRIAAEIVEGLAYAHQRGVVHLERKDRSRLGSASDRFPLRRHPASDEADGLRYCRRMRLLALLCASPLPWLSKP